MTLKIHHCTDTFEKQPVFFFLVVLFTALVFIDRVRIGAVQAVMKTQQERR